ncbi:hypothetical protein DIS18_00420 [Algibacter marinivivus]|uniref:Outer membrane protein beta-barrel domain-containing protein n=1 Tax=Algibacter marinivivus TaxID=2100723 RepID=A0A2U2X5M8_9FLAO|nr:hypothetical protein [Algibacter marinivivus]PWH83054.1 hypothetical protein DIS18_00420 [Algibacter marinivivus]
MKKIIFSIIIITSFYSFSQQKTFLKFEDAESKVSLYSQETQSNQQSTLTEAEDEYGSISENISFGLSLGFNNALESLKLAQISPIDNTVIITDAQKTNFVLSTAISVPISFQKKKAYRYLDNNGKQMGQVHRISEWSIIGVVNLVTLKGAESGSTFNQKLSGGLGLSYSFSSDFAIGLSYELISYRKPKDFLINQEGQEIQVNGEALKSIEISNDAYYFDRYAGTLALKIIYKLTKS